MDLNAPSNNDKDTKDDKREEKDKDKTEIPPLIGLIAPDNESNSDNDNNSEDEREEDVDQTLTKPMTMNHGFFSGWNSIFTESNEEDDYTTEEDDNKLTNSNSNPTSQLTKETKYKRVST